MQPNIVAAPDQAAAGQQRIDWVTRHMPVLAGIEADFAATRPFEGLRIVVCVHLEAKTARLALVLRAGGAEVAVTGSNPDSTRDDIVAALAAQGLHVYARHGASPEEMQRYMNMALDIRPHIIIDDGGDIVELVHGERADLLADLRGACEETTTGVMRARARAAAGELKLPVMLINEARCKYLFDNVHGTGQSVWDAVMRSTNLVVAGKSAVIVGFGWCGRGCAARALGLGARVTVCEIDPIKAADAAMHGFRVRPLLEALPDADIVLTVTGVRHALGTAHFPAMKDGVLLANGGHFRNEIDVPGLAALATDSVRSRATVTTYTLPDGRSANLLGDGNIVNIACGDGHPAEIMDTSFALQALSARHLARAGANMPAGAHEVPVAIDDAVARLKLKAMDIAIDALTPEQSAYVAGWEA